MNKDYCFQNQQKGLSIVELMIALTLSLILLAGVIQVFLSTRQTYQTNEVISRMQENGRFALDFMTRSVRLGGYLDPSSALPKPAGIEGGCSVIANDIPHCTVNGVGTASDTLAVAYQVPEDPTDNNKRRDCAGKELTGANIEKVLVNVFFVENGSLKCSSYLKGNGSFSWFSQKQSLVNGIDNIQILYGLSGGADTVKQYVSADRIEKTGNWSDIKTVRIAVLANSGTPSRPAAPKKDYYLLDSPPVSPNDGYVRQIFTTTVQLKNTY
jgi:type IV pilus assembly protein PilW